MRAIGYVRVSTSEQADSGAGLSAQRAAIEAACAAKGWALVGIEEDAGVSGKSLRRPGLEEAERRMAAGDADVLVAAKLDRFSRSVPDFALLIERAKRAKWALACLDVDIDMSTPTGELMATVISAMAQYERRLIGERTRVALAERRAQGVRLGRPQRLADETIRRVLALKAEGRGAPAIARTLADEGVPTATGGRWHPSTVQRVLASQRAQELQEAGA